ncbi:dihydrolipoyl dehydrogenase [Vagococcus sp. BWB3-3]|uniref:Dihydrolipoyl dehydrogenase n=1 Tax=Vagococcus allomyrinae TaxID=2794353 RepID=A0A940PBB2_9ENTE|nr:dihydrolipoyl dehydrogenase [Vagococcus allomyrinae]MBP1040878.1 dihydrolipoyl dehydrogenase [Vagococcus allomyrinae]
MEKTIIETLVIGSGPGGYVAAIRAAQLGQAVTIVEKDEIGGVCLNEGCIPSKALITAGHRYQESLNSDFLGLEVKQANLDFSQTQTWKNHHVVKRLTTGIESLLTKNQVKIIKGKARFIDPTQVALETEHGVTDYRFKQAIIATGSRPLSLKGFPFGPRILDSTGALNLSGIPKKLVIIGGGVIGAELGSAYANLGSEVTILEGSPQLLPSFEGDMVRVVQSAFKKKGIVVQTEALAKEAVVTASGVVVHYEVKGKSYEIAADYVLVTVGRRPNTDDLDLEKTGITVDQQGLIPVGADYRTKVANILAIGDVVAGLALAHKASYDGKVAAEVLAGKKVERDYRAVPGICFSDPELASTGLTLKEAEKTISAKAFQFPLQGNGRALSLNQNQGFARLIVDQDSTIVGGQIVGVNASEMIGEITLAVEAGLTVEDIALTIHAHPTLSEAIMDTAELAQGLPIHL